MTDEIKTTEDQLKADLKEIMAMNVFQRIHAIESHIDFMRQDTKGYNYKYLSLSAILHLVKSLIRRYRVVLNMQNVKSDTEIIGKEILFRNEYLFTWINIDKPDDNYSVPWFQTGKNGMEQGSGSAATYCKRYFLLEQFHIPNEKEDPDYIRAERAKKEKPKPVDKPKQYKQSAKLNDVDADLLDIDTLEYLMGYTAELKKMKGDYTPVEQDAIRIKLSDKKKALEDKMV